MAAKKTPEEMKEIRRANMAKARAKRKANIEARKLEAAKAVAETSFNEALDTNKPAEEQVAKEKVESAPAPEKPVSPLRLPRYLEAKIERAKSYMDSVTKEIDEFKSHPHFMEGDLPVNLPGLEGPGNAVPSINYMPEQWLDPYKHYRWSHVSMVDWHRAKGYEPVDYDTFAEQVNARGGRLRFTKTATGHIQCGDLILIETSQDHFQILKRRLAEKNASREGRAKNTLYQKGAELNVDVFENDMGPKVQKLVELLEKELGPNAARVFLGH